MPAPPTHLQPVLPTADQHAAATSHNAEQTRPPTAAIVASTRCLRSSHATSELQVLFKHMFQRHLII